MRDFQQRLEEDVVSLRPEPPWPGGSPGKRTRTQTMRPHSLQLQSDDAAADAGGGGSLGDPVGEVLASTPNSERVIELKLRKGGRWSVDGHLKLGFDGGEVAKAGGTKLGTFQQKLSIPAPRLQAAGERMSTRIATTLAKPGATFTLDAPYDALSVELGSELGTVSVQGWGDILKPDVSLAAVTVTVKGDVTKAVSEALGLVNVSGLRCTISMRVKIDVEPGDVASLARAFARTIDLERAAVEGEDLAQSILKDRERISKLQARVAQLERKGAKFADQLRRARKSLVKVRGRIGVAMRKLAEVRRSLAGLTEQIGAHLDVVASKAGRVIANRLIGKIGRLLMKTLPVIGLVLDVLDILQLIYMVFKLAIGEGRFDGNGAASGREADHEPGEVSGTEPGGDRERRPDDGADAGDDGILGDEVPDPDGAGERRSHPDQPINDTLDGGAPGPPGRRAPAPCVPATDDGDPRDGLGTTFSEDGGPGIGVTGGFVPSFETDGTPDPDRPNDTPGTGGGSDLAPPEDAAAGTGGAGDFVSVGPPSGQPSTADPSRVPVVLANPAAARVLSALRALGHPADPVLLAVVQEIVPPDFTDEEVSMLVLYLTEHGPLAAHASPEAILDALARAIEIVRARAEPAEHAAGHSTGRTKRPSATKGAGQTSRRSKVPPTPRGTGTTGGPAERTLVRAGQGLAPSVWSDGTLSMTAAQVERWLEEKDATVATSAAARRWVDAQKGKFVIGTGQQQRRLDDAHTEGSRAGDDYAGSIQFTFSSPVAGVSNQIIRFVFSPMAAAGARIATPRAVSLAPLERLITATAFTARLLPGSVVALDGFTVVIEEVHNEPFCEGPGAVCTFMLELRVLGVSDRTPQSWRGVKLAPGALISGAFELRAPAPR